MRPRIRIWLLLLEDHFIEVPPQSAVDIAVTVEVDTNQTSAYLNKLVMGGYAKRLPKHEGRNRITFYVDDTCSTPADVPLVEILRILKRVIND